MKPMKPEFQAKYLQYLNRKERSEEGFTLIELLVVIIIIGILAAIALPSLLGQVNKAKQSEAKNNVGAMSRAQQARYLEKQTFTSDITKLDIGIQAQTENYKYEIKVATAGANDFAFNKGTAIKKNLKHYAGVTASFIAANGESLTIGTACESDKPSANATETGYPDAGTAVTNDKIVCAVNYENLGS